jgi:hypothetical protein
MKLWIRGGEIDEIIRVSEDRQYLAALSVFEKRENFFGREWPGEPLHVVLYKHLHGGAVDRAGSVDGHVHAATDRHVSAQENFGSQIADCGTDH